MRANRHGFTLFEVAISLLVVTIAVLAVVALLPAGARAQELSRYRLFASAKAADLVNNFAQTTLDVRSNDFERGGGLNLGAPGGKQTAFGLINNRGLLHTNITSFDLERLMVTKWEGNIPLPTQIARRLDAPNSEIQRILDTGGQVFYSDPSPLGGLGTGRYASGEDRGTPPEMQKLVFGITSPAQQNLLTFHPYIPSNRELYPFPPRSLFGPPPYSWTFDLYFRYRNPATPAANVPTNCFYELLNDPGTRQTFVDRTGNNNMYQRSNWEWLAYLDYLRSNESRIEYNNLTAFGPGFVGPYKMPSAGSNSHPWQNATNSSTGSDWSPWRAGLPEYRRLALQHWPRLAHSLHAQKGNLITISSADAPYTLPFKTVSVKIGDDWVDKWVDSSVPARDVAAPPSNSMIRGITSGPRGTGMAAGHRGTDIMNEDHETSVWKLIEQIRLGLPGLERRVMYRTAALALWARTDGHPSIMSARPDPVTGMVANGAQDPNVADAYGNLPNSRNPFLQVVQPPANARDIHPAQIMALAHLAHASMLVIGYKPPFIDDMKTVSPVDDKNLILSQYLELGNDPTEYPFMETIPYRAKTKEEYYLWDPKYELSGPNWAANTAYAFGAIVKNGSNFYTCATAGTSAASGGPTGTGTNIIDNSCRWDYLQGFSMNALLPSKPLRPNATAADRDWNDIEKIGNTAMTEPQCLERAMRRADNPSLPIIYRRHIGPTLNPFPPPYADRGAFTWWGERRYTTASQKVSTFSWISGMRPSAYDNDDLIDVVTAYDTSLAGNDTLWARNAHETMMRWMAVYTAENPYDLVVPRPMNRPTMLDRSLFAWDLFNPDGSARRDSSANVRKPADLTKPGNAAQDWSPFHPVTWGSAIASFGAPFNPPDVWFSNSHYRNKPGSIWGYNSNPILPAGDPTSLPAGYEWGIPYVKVDAGGNRIVPEDDGFFGDMWTSAIGWYGDDRVTVRNRRASMDGPMGFALRLAQLHGKAHRSTYDILKNDSAMSDSAADGFKGLWLDRSSPKYPERWWYNRPFAPQARMRELVFWAVDWKNYEDAEAVPSAEIDLARMGKDWRTSSAGNGLVSYGSNFDNLLGHPEFTFMWLNPARDKTVQRWDDGRNVRSYGTHRVDDRFPRIAYNNGGNGSEPSLNVWGYLGLWGADRNGNGQFDRGQIPKTTRMRAVEVARFVFYDPVGWTAQRF